MPFVRLVGFCLPFSLVLLAASIEAADAPPTAVTVEQIKAGELPIVLEYPARTTGYREVQVRAQVGGILQERTYQEGSRVQKDQVLFRIDPRPYEAALARAKGALAQEQARFRQTDRDLKRIRELQKKGFASESELDNAISNFEQSKANIEAAQAEVQSRQIDLDYTTVKAPITGITSKESVSEGSLIVAGDPSASLLTQITQLDPIFVNFAYPDAEAERLRRELSEGSLVPPSSGKLSVEVYFGDGSAYPTAGEVDFTDSLIDRGTGTVSARGVVPNPEQKLLPGQFVRVQVKGLTRPNAITVPERSVAQGPRGTFVYVVDEQSVARMRQVTTGDTAGGRWVILAGVSDGERVIVDGLAKVRPDSPVQVEEAKAATPASPAQE
ncbi:efflux RND transporter periplasmic adaptor subunit [Ectopseudomonas toyotomiensis]|jgi:membrane fusion protein (multidrug efflux system)|uniref:Efflux RND transporter periplasmic adaptor subunit n=1 Tax=Ectopseudomonas toyotomiensis TaxID=554344 RepID=A0A1I5Y165_9GAMM|nr:MULTISPECIES: efflux RND transporter periplasmic adaptor subunit [Pseudomonas]MBG0843806.1 efflux RND transporter periplasmic adaptor subunit [Pseudomonas chengduensis]PIA69338.1 efflux RND transporter periplasmic adaptor subunit [Pseudomonas toyotomiensis]QSL91092.1 efflux RND transporter periplasmic adaptor subunit [Pseudomonas toyotomiensis]SDA51729.1 membrane fusion protein, multidrug efflux system [Pseudomonas sp. NFPP33]SFQ37949.1 membrane fusion protein, multidrug efflux system [Pseu